MSDLNEASQTILKLDREDKKKSTWERFKAIQKAIQKNQCKFTEQPFDEPDLMPYDDREADFEFEAD